MTHYDSAEFWRKVARSYHAVSLASPAHFKKYDEISSLLLKNKVKTIIDYGAGSCILEELLIKKGFRGKVYAIDSSPHMLAIAQKNLSTHKDKEIIFITHDINKPLANNIIEDADAIVAINVIFLLNDKGYFIKIANKQLKLDGLLVIVEPKQGSINVKRILSESFQNLSVMQTLKQIFKMMILVGHIIKMYFYQSQISKLVKEGTIQYNQTELLVDLLTRSGFQIEQSDGIQADQNYLLQAKKIKDL